MQMMYWIILIVLAVLILVTIIATVVTIVKERKEYRKYELDEEQVQSRSWKMMTWMQILGIHQERKGAGRLF